MCDVPAEKGKEARQDRSEMDQDVEEVGEDSSGPENFDDKDSEVDTENLQNRDVDKSSI